MKDSTRNNGKGYRLQASGFRLQEKPGSLKRAGHRKRTVCSGFPACLPAGRFRLFLFPATGYRLPATKSSGFLAIARDNGEENL
jgi:hypothetical protein